MKELGLEVKTLENPLHMSSTLGTRVRVDKICQDCELEISGILLTVDLRVTDMSEFDDILIYSQSKKEHEDHLRIILQVLKEHQLYAKFSKCELWITEVRFLGHLVSALGVSVDTEKVEAVMSWERPKLVFEIHSYGPYPIHRPARLAFKMKRKCAMIFKF